MLFTSQYLRNFDRYCNVSTRFTLNACKSIAIIQYKNVILTRIEVQKPLRRKGKKLYTRGRWRSSSLFQIFFVCFWAWCGWWHFLLIHSNNRARERCLSCGMRCICRHNQTSLLQVIKCSCVSFIIITGISNLVPDPHKLPRTPEEQYRKAVCQSLLP